MNAQITNASVQGRYVSTFLERPSAIVWREIFLFKIHALEVKISGIFSSNLSQKSLQNGLLLCYALGSLSTAADFRKKNCTKTLKFPHHSGIVVIVDQFYMSFKSQR